MSPQLYANRLSNFNPRTPCGVRLVCLAIRCYLLNFNPRTPCGVRLCFDRLSRWLKDFNPRTPCGVRQALFRFGIKPDTISIHAPLAGCDVHTIAPCFHLVYISIHAPLAGCDHYWLWYLISQLYFNPRTPCGVRLHATVSSLSSPEFQSTHPLRGATISPFSVWVFNITFQSTHPLRGATMTICFGLVLFIDISIHAPLAGCDCFSPWLCLSRSVFQSTHPLRGATPKRAIGGLYYQYFNPRTPCGVRLV